MNGENIQEYSNMIKRFKQKAQTEIPDPDEIIRIKRIQTIGREGDQTIERWTLDVFSVNDIAARQRARTYVRRKVPNSRNIFSPSEEGEEKQTTLGEFFTNSIDMKFRTIDIVIVKPIRT